jgi:hypothetical protein
MASRRAGVAVMEVSVPIPRGSETSHIPRALDGALALTFGNFAAGRSSRFSRRHRIGDQRPSV